MNQVIVLKYILWIAIAALVYLLVTKSSIKETDRKKDIAMKTIKSKHKPKYPLRSHQPKLNSDSLTNIPKIGGKHENPVSNADTVNISPIDSLN